MEQLQVIQNKIYENPRKSCQSKQKMNLAATLQNTLYRLLTPLKRLFYIPRCPFCNEVLELDEHVICHECDTYMGLYMLFDGPLNPIEIQLGRQINLVHANSYFYYSKKRESVRNMIFQLKYHGNKELGLIMGQRMARKLQPTGFFEGIDCIVPVPLHPRREAHRGYNQSEVLAQGIHQITGIPIDTAAATRVRYNVSQTQLGDEDRRKNVTGLFRINRPRQYDGKHLLLIDDVITTGSTICALASAFTQAGIDVRFSVLTLSCSSAHFNRKNNSSFSAGQAYSAVISR